jgi:hypothetical protein
MDKEKGNSDKRLQQSIREVVDKQRYEWVTLRVEDNGQIREE